MRREVKSNSSFFGLGVGLQQFSIVDASSRGSSYTVTAPRADGNVVTHWPPSPTIYSRISRQPRSGNLDGDQADHKDAQDLTFE